MRRGFCIVLLCAMVRFAAGQATNAPPVIEVNQHCAIGQPVGELASTWLGVLHAVRTGDEALQAMNETARQDVVGAFERYEASFDGEAVFDLPWQDRAVVGLVTQTLATGRYAGLAKLRTAWQMVERDGQTRIAFVLLRWSEKPAFWMPAVDEAGNLLLSEADRLALCFYAGYGVVLTTDDLTDARREQGASLAAAWDMPFAVVYRVGRGELRERERMQRWQTVEAIAHPMVLICQGGGRPVRLMLRG